MAENGEMFKTTLMGGFDKDDVLARFQELKNASYAVSRKAEERENQIQDLNRRIAEQEEQIHQLQRDISEKYQSYIDNYESIAKLVFDAKIRAGEMIAEAEAECAKKRQETDAVCSKQQREIEERCGALQKETEEKCERMMRETTEKCRRMQRETNLECEQKVAMARAKGEELAALYEEKIQSQAEEIGEHMEQELSVANEKYGMIYTEMEHLTSVLEVAQHDFMEAFKRVNLLKREMFVSADNLREFLEDPIKAVEEPRDAGMGRQSTGGEDEQDPREAWAASGDAAQMTGVQEVVETLDALDPKLDSGTGEG